MVQELTADTFKQVVIDSPVPVLVDFWSPTCAPCRRITPVIDELAAGKKDETAGVRSWAAMALSMMGKEARPALTALQEALDEEDSNLRAAAALALPSAGRAPK
jgi:thioredoxin 1